MLFRDFFLAIRSFGEGIGFVSKHRLWSTLFIPVILNLIAFTIVGILGWYYSKDLVVYLSGLFGLDTKNDWLYVVQIIFVVLIRAIVLLAFFKLYRYIILIFYAPILAYLTEKIQEKLTGATRPFSVQQMVKDVFRGIKVACINIVIELLLTSFLLLLSVVVSPLALVLPFVLFALESFFYGFSMMDYRNEFWYFSSKESRAFIWKHKGMALGVGTMFNLFLWIPVFGVLFAPIFSLISAAIAVQKIDPRN